MNEIKKNCYILFIICGVLFGLLCFFAGRAFPSKNGDPPTRELEDRLSAIQRRNAELIANNAQLIRELNESAREFGELREINESALGLAERSANGFVELTATLGNSGGDLAVLIQRQRAINSIVVRLQEENRQSINALREGNKLGGRNGAEASRK